MRTFLLKISFYSQMFIFYPIKVILGSLGLIPINSFINAQESQT